MLVKKNGYMYCEDCDSFEIRIVPTSNGGYYRCTECTEEETEKDYFVDEKYIK